MKIGIISDSHNDLSAIDNAICLAPDVACWFHAGDSISDAEYLMNVAQKQVFAVPGNIDWFSTAHKEVLVEIAGIKVLITHGHQYNVKSTRQYLYEHSLKTDANLIIYGHTHIGKQEIIEHKYLVNPGSVSEPRDGLKPSFMIADISPEEIKINRIFLEENNK